jgi:hypothetical protein
MQTHITLKVDVTVTIGDHTPLKDMTEEEYSSCLKKAWEQVKDGLGTLNMDPWLQDYIEIFQDDGASQQI